MTRAAGVAAFAVALAAVSVQSTAAAPAPPPLAHGSTAGASWDVTAAGTGAVVVRLTLPGGVPVRAALPQLAVDGVVLGTARQDPDGRTLRLRTTDPRAAAASRVDLAWNDVVVGTRVVAPAVGPVANRVADGPLLAQDPAAARTYPVTRADYDLGETAVRLPGLGGKAVELRAAVYLPAGAPGARPVVVFLHGRHQPCYEADGAAAVAYPPAWPCPRGQLPVPSYLGYGEAANALAAAGYVVVSISADGINALDYTALDGGAQARGELVLAHLDQLRAWNTGRPGGAVARALKGRLDLSDVGLMGHSRGGEGVVKAALLDAERPVPFGIRAVMPLAPVDFARSTLPGVPMAVVLPYCDGDVSDQQGQHFYEDTRYAAAAGADDVLRTSLLVLGANHNYFNSEWTPGISAAPSFDDWYGQDDPVCGASAPSRLRPAEQRAVGAAYVSGFFRLHLGGERAFLPLFDGTGGRAASAGRAVVLTEAQQPTSSRTDLAPLAPLAAGPGAVTLRGHAVYCASYGRFDADGLPPCASPPRSSSSFPSWTPAYLAGDVPASPMVHMTWNPSTPASVTVQVPPDAAAGVRQALTFRATTADRGTTDLLVTVTDTSGRSAGVPVGRVSDALSPLPAISAFGGAPESKTWLQTVRVPLAGLPGVDLGHLAAVTLASKGPTGNVYLADLALDTPAPGAGGPTTLPVVSIGDADAFVDQRATRAAAAVTLSRPSRVPVTAWVQTGLDGGGALPTRAVQVTVPPGSTSTVVTFRVEPGSSGPSGIDEYGYSLSVPVNAVVGDGFGVLTVYSSIGAGAPVAAGGVGLTAARGR